MTILTCLNMEGLLHHCTIGEPDAPQSLPSSSAPISAPPSPPQGTTFSAKIWHKKIYDQEKLCFNFFYFAICEFEDFFQKSMSIYEKLLKSRTLFAGRRPLLTQLLLLAILMFSLKS